MPRKERSRHEIGVGQWRVTTKRRWFHRGEHFPNAHRESVEEITERLYRQIDQPGLHIGPDGKYYVWNGTFTVPSPPDPQQAVIVIAAPEGNIGNFPALATEDPLTEASADALLNEWIRRQMEGADDSDQ